MGRKLKVTKDMVALAREEILSGRSELKTVSAQNIRQITGRGSLSTIYRFLGELQEGQDQKNTSVAKNRKKNKADKNIKSDASDTSGHLSSRSEENTVQALLRLEQRVNEMAAQLRALLEVQPKSAASTDRDAQKVKEAEAQPATQARPMTGVPLFDDIHFN